MGGDGRSGVLTWREKNRRKVRMITVLITVLVLANGGRFACLLLTEY
jgi:hypothetical protein